MKTKDSGVVRIMRGVTVNREIDEVYQFWRDFENFPNFMHHIESVTVDGSRSHWVAKEPAGQKAEWDAEITEDRPGKIIAWRTVADSDVEHEGSVEFAHAPGDRGTEVRVTMTYEPPGVAGISKLFGADPDRQIRDDIKRFKQIIETGEILRSDSVPAGTGLKKSKQRVAQPQPAGAQR